MIPRRARNAPDLYKGFFRVKVVGVLGWGGAASRFRCREAELALFGVRLLILGFGRVCFFGVAFCQRPFRMYAYVRRSFFYPCCCAFLCCEFCVGFGVG